MKQTKWILIIAAIYILSYLAHAFILQKTVYGDGIFYFSWIHSMVIDHDINFANEYSHFGVTAPGNKHPIGTPLFWLPLYGQAHTVLQNTGYELPYQILVGMSSVLAALSGLIILYRLLLQSFSKNASALAIISIAGASNLLFYGAVDPVNSHAVSFFAATVFLSLLFSKKAPPFLTGFALGFCALVRPQDAVFGILAIPRFFVIPAKAGTQFFFGALLAFSPQLLAWYQLYGTILISPYLSGGESFTWWSPHFFDVLFSPAGGLFLWTPMTLLAIAGFAFWHDPRRIWFLILFTLEVAIVGSWSTWWQGASYSGRMLISMLPILAFGLAAFFTRLANLGLKAKQVLLTIIYPLSIINVLLIIRFLLQT